MGNVLEFLRPMSALPFEGGKAILVSMEDGTSRKCSTCIVHVGNDSTLEIYSNRRRLLDWDKMRGWQPWYAQSC